MSESSFIVLQLDRLDPIERKRRARDVRLWLLDKAVIVARTVTTEDGYGDWEPGQSWRSVVESPLPAAFEQWPPGEVDISTTRLIYSAMANFEDPACPRCGWVLSSSSELASGLMDTWWTDDIEPRAACESCGWSDLIGDWPTNYPPGLVSGLIVQFHSWPPFRTDFVAELESLLGPGRCKSFWTHL